MRHALQPRLAAKCQMGSRRNRQPVPAVLCRQRYRRRRGNLPRLWRGILDNPRRRLASAACQKPLQRLMGCSCRKPCEGQRAQAVGPYPPEFSPAAEQPAHRAGTDKAPQDGRGHEAGEKHGIVDPVGIAHAERAEGAAKRRPVGDVLWIGQRQYGSGPQRCAGGADSFSGGWRCQAFPPAVEGKPCQIGRAADAHRDPQRVGLQQQADSGKPEDGPGGVPDERADLNGQCRPVAAIDPAADGFGEHGTRRGVEYQAEQEGHAEQAEDGRQHRRSWSLSGGSKVKSGCRMGCVTLAFQGLSSTLRTFRDPWIAC